MIIPITIPSTSNPTLTPSLAKIGHDEIVLIELQGSLQVECSHDSERNGQFVGKLSINESGVRDCSLHKKRCFSSYSTTAPCRTDLRSRSAITFLKAR